MRKLMMIVSVAALAVTMPAMAKPGNGHGGAKAHAGAKAKAGPLRTRADVRANTRVDRTRVDRTRDSDRDGIPDYRERRLDRNGDGIDDRTGQRYGANACPPGLAKKDNGCLPPGQARKMFSEGQRIPTGYDFYTPYAQIPATYQSQYALDPNGRYIYRDSRLYVVDPATQLVTRVIDGLR